MFRLKVASSRHIGTGPVHSTSRSVVSYIPVLDCAQEQHGALVVSLLSERSNLAYIKRVLTLKDLQTGEVGGVVEVVIANKHRRGRLFTSATQPGLTTVSQRRPRRSCSSERSFVCLALSGASF